MLSSLSQPRARSSRCLLSLTAVLLLSCPLLASELPAGEIVLASVHATVGTLDSDEILLAKRQDIPVPIASITKLMTAIVVLDGDQPLDEWLPIVSWSE